MCVLELVVFMKFTVMKITDYGDQTNVIWSFILILFSQCLVRYVDRIPYLFYSSLRGSDVSKLTITLSVSSFS